MVSNIIVKRGGLGWKWADEGTGTESNLRNGSDVLKCRWEQGGSGSGYGQERGSSKI